MRLTDTQWTQLEPFLIGKIGDPGVRGKNDRQYIEAVLWVVSGDNRWCDLPTEFGTWNKAYMRFHRWNDANAWRQVATDVKHYADIHSLLFQIVEYGDNSRIRKIERGRRRRARLRTQGALNGKSIVTADHSEERDGDETMHWVSLVT